MSKLPTSVLKSMKVLIEQFEKLLKMATKNKVVDGAFDVFNKSKNKLKDYLLKKIDKKLGYFVKQKTKRSCFAKGTLVYTSSGHIPIEEIKIGDLVYAKDPDIGEFSEKKVLELSLQKTYILYNINIGNENFGVTAEHPFWVYGKGFVAVEDLVVGDEIVTNNKQNTIDNYFGASIINKIEKIFYKELQHVYNFTVEDMHTYFVGESCVFVHNNDCLNTELGRDSKNLPKIEGRGVSEGGR